MPNSSGGNNVCPGGGEVVLAGCSEAGELDKGSLLVGLDRDCLGPEAVSSDSSEVVSNEEVEGSLKSGIIADVPLCVFSSADKECEFTDIDNL